MCFWAFPPSSVPRNARVTWWTGRCCYSIWKSIHPKQSYKTEPAEARCLCRNPVIASPCQQFTKEMNLPSYSRVRKTESVKREKARVLCWCTERRDSVKCHFFGCTAFFFLFSFQSWWLDVWKLVQSSSLSNRIWDAVLVSRISWFYSTRLLLFYSTRAKVLRLVVRPLHLRPLNCFVKEPLLLYVFSSPK